MWRLLGLVGALLFVVTPGSSSACSGDCDGNDVVTIDELVTAVRIALAQSPPSVCPAADDGGDGRVTVDDLVRAVNAALRGCPPTPTATVTASPSLSPTTETPSITVSATPTGEATATITPSVAASPSTSPTASAAPTQAATAPPSPTSATPSVTASPTDVATPTSTSTGTRTSTSVGSTTATASPTGTVSPSPTVSATRSRTATATASPSATPTGGPLGTRRFSLDPSTSAFFSVLAQGMVEVTGFTGYLDLQAGAPDPQTGRAVINVTGASTYLQLKVGTDLICIRPVVPATAVGIVDCDGGTNLGVSIRQDHRIGVVGQAGFTAQDCSSAGGTVEVDPLPHGNVCNGPLAVEPSASGDSGAGAVYIAPDGALGVNGLPAEVRFAVGGECPGEQGDGFTDVLPLISRHTRTEIVHADNGNDTLVYDNPGEAFSCPAWTQENGPGQLVLAFPTLHGAFLNIDVINVFVFDD